MSITWIITSKCLERKKYSPSQQQYECCTNMITSLVPIVLLMILVYKCLNTMLEYILVLECVGYEASESDN